MNLSHIEVGIVFDKNEILQNKRNFRERWRSSKTLMNDERKNWIVQREIKNDSKYENGSFFGSNRPSTNKRKILLNKRFC